MREIKFRAWSEEHKTMVYDVVIDKLGWAAFGCGGGFDTLMEFAGTNDKAGNELYENDIAEIIWRGKPVKGIITFESSMFKILGFSLCTFAPGNITKLGNVFDNPELLNNPGTGEKEGWNENERRNLSHYFK